MAQDLGSFDHHSPEFAAHWRENFEQLAPFVGKTIRARTFERLRAFAEETLRGEEAFLRRREVEGIGCQNVSPMRNTSTA